MTSLSDLLERARIEEQIDALPCGQLAGLVLPAQTILPAAERRTALQLLEIFECVHE